MTKPNDTILLGGAALAIVYFGIIRPITNKLGLTQSEKDKIEENRIEEANNNQGWNPNFWQTVPNNRYPKVTRFKDSYAEQYAKDIYNAFGFFNDDEDKIYTVFRAMRSQVHLSQVVYYFNKNYKMDLLRRLQTPWYYMKDGLDPKEFAIVASMVNKLPVIVTN